MRAAGAPVCARKVLSPGILLDNREAYDTALWPSLETRLGLSAAPQIAAVATGGPADRAGLREGDTLLAIDGHPSQSLVRSAQDLPLLADHLLDYLETLASDHDPVLTIARGTARIEVPLHRQAICLGRVSLESRDGFGAHSDSSRVAIRTGTLQYLANDDELAVLLGHELGHVLTDDPAPSSLSERRRLERRADLDGAALAKCAGFDPVSGAAFWRRLRKRPFGWLSIDVTHGSLEDRAERIEAFAATVTCPLGPAMLDRIARQADATTAHRSRREPPGAPGSVKQALRSSQALPPATQAASKAAHSR